MQTPRQREGWATDEAAEAAYRELVSRCRVALTVLPRGCAFSHLTAAHLLRLLAVGDLVWRITLPDGRVIKVVGEYQGEAFHSSPLQRARDERRADGLGDDDWVVEDIWKGDVGEDVARRDTVTRFAAALEVPDEQLRLSEVGWRFFSTHAMELAVQRQMRRSAS